MLPGQQTSLNREKYVFGVTELTFLEVVISAKGVKPDKKRRCWTETWCQVHNPRKMFSGSWGW